MAVDGTSDGRADGRVVFQISASEALTNLYEIDCHAADDNTAGERSFYVGEPTIDLKIASWLYYI
jgi:hypothetical protein